MNLRVVYILLLRVFLFSESRAQESLPIRNFTSVDYQAQQQNWAVSQSNEGLIYVGNSDGLLEYDGDIWQLYPFANGQPVRSVLCDSSRIYVGGYGEFGFWERGAGGVLQYHSLSDTCSIASAQSEEIWHILKTEEGITFQSFSRMYLYSSPHSLTEISAAKNFMFAYNVGKQVFLQLIGDGLYRLENGKFFNLENTAPLSGTSVSAILSNNQGGALIFTSKNGIYQWESGKLSLWESEILRRTGNDLINRVIRLQNGTYAVGTQLSGVYIVAPDGSILHHFSKQNGLQNNSVLALYQDRQQNLWVALDNGIDLVPLSSPVSQYRSETAPLEATYSIALWKNKLYVGTNRAIFWKPWPSEEPFKVISGLEGHIWELKIYDDQLICGHNEGTFLLKEDGYERISSVPGGWTSLRYQHRGQDVLLQGTYTGISVFRKNSKGKWIFSHNLANIPPIPIKHIGIDSEGKKLWLAHAHKGLFTAILNDDISGISDWKQITEPESLANAYNVDITQWKKHILITAGNRFYSVSDSGQLVSEKSFVHPTELPLKIREGIAGDLLRIYPNHIALENPGGKTTNIPLSLIRNNETIITIDNRYYFFCTHNGYFVYDRNHPDQVDESIKPVLRGVYDQLDKSISFAIGNKITIPAESRSILIRYFMPVYGEDVRFRYKVEGLKPNWSDWSDLRLINLPHLSPGEYTFVLQNSYNNQELIFLIEILPFWYESAWARILMIIGAIVILTALYYLQERRMKAQRNKLIREHEAKMKQKELENQKRIIELQNEKLASEINLKSQQLSNIAINVIRKNEILESIKDELMEVKKELGQQLPNAHYQKLLDSVNRNLSGKDDWTLFEDNFDEVHGDFFKRLKEIHPDITPSELRLAAALRMNLSSKEIAPILGISVRGVEIKRYRLRKKLGLDEEINLNKYMMDI